MHQPALHGLGVNWRWGAATAVVLRDALGGLRQASISGLLADPATRLLDTT